MDENLSIRKSCTKKKPDKNLSGYAPPTVIGACPGSCHIVTSNFPPKVLGIFFRFFGKGEHRAEARSAGDNVGV